MFRRRFTVVIASISLTVGFLISATPKPQRIPPGKAGRRDQVWYAISPSGNHTCGIQIDHTLWCWRHNGYGQLGLGHTRNRLYPRRVRASTRPPRTRARRDDRGPSTLAPTPEQRFGEVKQPTMCDSVQGGRVRERPWCPLVSVSVEGVPCFVVESRSSARVSAWRSVS